MRVKIVFSSTVEQDEEIDKLLEHLRTVILPKYMTEEELRKYEDMKLLQFSGDLYNGTLGEAFQLMTALQTIITIIQAADKNDKQLPDTYQTIFYKNVQQLHAFGLFFPFKLSYFMKQQEEEKTIISKHTALIH